MGGEVLGMVTTAENVRRTHKIIRRSIGYQSGKDKGAAGNLKRHLLRKIV
jgi:hypothetical protein